MQLVVIAGPDKGQSFSLGDGGSVLFGRSKQTSGKLNDPAVSRVHCEVELKGKTVILRDLDSASGSFVNGKRMNEGQLKHNDVLKIGGTELRVVDPEGQLIDGPAPEVAGTVPVSPEYLAQVRSAARTRPVPLYVGNTWLPRHVVLVLDAELHTYEPSVGRVEQIDPDDFTRGSLDLGGWSRPWFTVLPR